MSDLTFVYVGINIDEVVLTHYCVLLLWVQKVLDHQYHDPSS